MTLRAPNAPVAAALRPIIVRSCNWVGEAVLSQPAICLLEAHGYAPRLVGKGWAASLLGGHGWPIHARPQGLQANTALLRRLRGEAQAVDAGFARRPNALLLTNSFSSALEMRLAGLRPLGYRRDGRSLLLDRALPRPLAGHALQSYWRLACAFLGIDIAPPRAIDWRVAPADQTAADALIITQGLGARWVLLCPFAATAIKQQDKTWPAFAALAATLAARGMRLAACPGPGEEAALRARFPAVVSLEGVPMGVYAGLARRASLVVAGDTGPAHLAAAVGAPLLSVLGPTPPEQWAPWGPTVTVLRRWPDWPSADEVAAQVLAMARAAAHG